MSKKAEDTGRDANGRYVPGRKPDYTTPIGNDFASKYKEEYCEQLIAYFDKPPYEVYKDDNGREYLRPVAYPTFEGFATSIGVTADTLKNWSMSHECFGSAYALAQDIQRKILITNGLTGSYNHAFAKFIASCTMGMHERTESDSTVKISVELPPEVDEEAY